MFLAVFFWLFSRVTTNCQGGWELVDHYDLMATVVRVRLSDRLCESDDGSLYFCPESYYDEPIAFRQIFDPGTGTDVIIPEDFVSNPELLPSCGPPPCVTAWPYPFGLILNGHRTDPVVAVDTQLYRSTDQCP